MPPASRTRSVGLSLPSASNSNTHAGPGPDVGTNRDGRTNAKTQESSDLDAQTEWSKHNKGLLDDLGLD
jgi:hypothetical protein